MIDNERLTEIWADTFLNCVTELEQRTNVPAESWKTAGRKTNAHPQGEDLEFMRNEGLKQVTEYNQWLGQSGWQIATMPDDRPGIEWDGIVDFGGMPVKFIVDLVFKSGNSLVVTDFKTGRHTPFGCEQLALYASAIEKLHGIRPKFGAFYMTRKAALGDLIDLDRWGIDYFDYQFKAVNEHISSGYYPANVGQHCGWCSFADYCAAVGGSSSEVYPITTGKEQA